MGEYLHVTTPPGRCRQVSATIFAGASRCEEPFWQVLAPCKVHGGGFRRWTQLCCLLLQSRNTKLKTKQTTQCGPSSESAEAAADINKPAAPQARARAHTHTSWSSAFTRAPMTPKDVKRRYSKGRVLVTVLRKGYRNNGMWACRNICRVSWWEATHCSSARALQTRLEACAPEVGGHGHGMWGGCGPPSTRESHTDIRPSSKGLKEWTGYCWG